MADFIHSSAAVKVSLTALEDPGKEMKDALLNPDTLPINIDVAVGELNPVGWSHSILQYGHTKSMTTTIELYFSNQLLARKAGLSGGQYIDSGDVSQHVAWLASFCYSKQPGLAPSPLLILWPHVLDIAVVVKRFSATYQRFSRNLQATAAKVTLECAELRFTFRGSGDLQKGFTQRDPLLGYMTYSNSVGYRMNLRGK